MFATQHSSSPRNSNCRPRGLAVLFWVGCGTVEQCPQGTQEAGDQCLLNSMDNEPKFLESTDVETVPTDAQADGDSIDDSWDDTSEEVDGTSAVNFTAILNTEHHSGATDRRQARSRLPTQLNTSGRSEGQAGLGGTSEPFNYRSNPLSGPRWARWTPGSEKLPGRGPGRKRWNACRLEPSGHTHGGLETTMTKKMLINVDVDESRVAIVEDGRLANLELKPNQGTT